MKFKSFEEKLVMLAAYQEQVANEDAIREAMNTILQKGGYEEADLPQNDDLRAAVQALGSSNPYIVSALDNLGVDYIECAGFKCFKADDAETGIETIYFVSPTVTFSLDDGWL